MNLSMFARLGGNARKLVWGTVLTGLVLAAGATAIGDVTEEAKRTRSQKRESVSLFAGPTAVLTGNQLQCGLDNNGNVCTDVFNSPTGGGGFWPVGSPDGYIFNTGLQIAGIMGADGGPWAGDTAGAYFFDARGTQAHGTALTNIFDSLNPDDLANWPAEAFVQDESLFQPVLIGRKTASQQDSWVQYWEGDPKKIANRKHPMGIKVTQRSLAWNFPSGNESLIYFIYDFENVTNDAEFQRLNEQAFFAGDNKLPDAGITIDQMYAAFSTDMDVTNNATENFSTAILPFDIGLSYHGGFAAPDFVYPPDLFFPPFFTNAPGIVGVKYLKSPINPATGEPVGLTLFSNTQNPSSTGAQFIDPFGDKQLWRYLSGKLDPAQGDPPCNVVPEVVTGDPATTEQSVCFVFQQQADTRFYQASGPFSLPAGEKGTIVVAYIIAPTVATMPDGSPSGILANAGAGDNPPGFPSFHPGFASARGCDVNGNNCTVTQTAAENAVKPIERGSGWVDYTGPAPSGRGGGALEGPENKLDQFQVEVVPGSLLGRSLVAQTIFDNKFLLGFAPDQPTFYLVPGDNNVTIIWDESPSEQTGDPFFAVASDPTSALFNPNYREFDVEGYRVWRGTAPGSLNLIAQFDKNNTTFTDFTCETVPPDEDIGNPAGTGYATGETCPFASSPAVRNINSSLIFNNGSAGGPPGGGVVRTAGGAAVATNVITAITDDESGPTQPLGDTGVPFVFSDNDVQNNFTYFYAVSAFDVNSPASGPHTLRSARQAQAVVPRKTNSGLGVVFSATSAFTGDDGEPLDTSLPSVQPDPDTGIFPGPQPPTNGVSVLIVPDPAQVAGLLAPGSALTGVIDSVTTEDITFGCAATGGNALGACWKLYMTFDNGTDVQQVVTEGTTPVWNAFGENAENEFNMGAGVLPWGADQLAQFGLPTDAGTGVAAGVSGKFQQSIGYSSFEGQSNRRAGVVDIPSNVFAGGSRWFSGTTETTPDPTALIRVGHLDEVDSVWAPIHHTPTTPGGSTLPGSGQIQCFGYVLGFLGRAADVQFTWTGGTVEARDITHHVPIVFKDAPEAGTYGFMNTDMNGNGVIDWQDFDYLDTIRQSAALDNTFCEFGSAGITNPPRGALEPTPQIQPIFLGGGNPLAAGDPMPPTGNGFAMYINGERYFFLTDQLPPDGTVWTLRTYTGIITADDNATLDPSNYQLVPGGNVSAIIRPPLIPGLQFALTVDNAGQQSVGPIDLSEVHTVPDPYLATSQLDRGPTTKGLQFVNLPPKATIRIYTLTGVLVNIVEHDDPSGGGREEWNLRNRNNQFVASGVYFFHVQAPGGDEFVGKFTVVNFAGQN